MAEQTVCRDYSKDIDVDVVNADNINIDVDVTVAVWCTSPTAVHDRGLPGVLCMYAS